MNDTYREGNLKLLEMMISQINDIIENTRHGDGPKSFVIDMNEINKKLCSTNKLAYLLETETSTDQLPNNEDIYSMDFFESINNYMDTKYIYEFYNVYTLMEMRGDLQRIYDNYNKQGYLPWDNKDEDTMKESIVKGDRSEVAVKERKSLDVVEYTAQFDIGVAELECDMPYILEMTNPDGSFERRVIVITTMSIQRINYTYWEESGGGLKRDTLLPSSFCGDNAYKLYKITGEDLK